MSWIGAERADLETARARIDQQLEAVTAIEAACARYAELAGTARRRASPRKALRRLLERWQA